MIHVTVTTMPHLFSDDMMVQLGRFIQTLVASTLDVPDDEKARVREADVSVEFRSYRYGINLRAVRIDIVAPDHLHRRQNLEVHLGTICAALRSCPHLPSRSITDKNGGVSVQLVLAPSITMHL